MSNFFSYHFQTIPYLERIFKRAEKFTLGTVYVGPSLKGSKTHNGRNKKLQLVIAFKQTNLIFYTSQTNYGLGGLKNQLGGVQKSICPFKGDKIRNQEESIINGGSRLIRTGNTTSENRKAPDVPPVRIKYHPTPTGKSCFFSMKVRATNSGSRSPNQ
jgi:hypothetical protein